MSAGSQFLPQGMGKIREAIAAETAGNAEAAIPLYIQGLEFLQMAKKCSSTQATNVNPRRRPNAAILLRPQMKRTRRGRSGSRPRWPST